MSDAPNFNREDKAVDALITGALHSWSLKEVSEAESDEFISTHVDLTDSEKAALNRVREQLRNRNHSTEEPSAFREHQAMESPYMAMNRENAKDQMPTEVREEIERRRAALLAELKAKKRPAK